MKDKLSKLTKKQLILIGGASALGISILTTIIAVSATPRRSQVENVETKYRKDHQEVLSKTEDNITLEDKFKVNVALVKYDELSEQFKDKLIAEKNLLARLLVKITALENNANNQNTPPVKTDNPGTNEDNAEKNFKQKHNLILGKSVFDITTSDKQDINNALSDYSLLETTTKAKLSNEKRNLDDKIKRVQELEQAESDEKIRNQAIDNFKSKHATILNKELINITTSDKDLINAALSDYELLVDSIKPRLTTEKRNLDEKAAKVAELEKSQNNTTSTQPEDPKQDNGSNGGTVTQPEEVKKLKVIINTKSLITTGNGANTDIRMYIDGWEKQDMINYLGYLKHHATTEEVTTFATKMADIYNNSGLFKSGGRNQKWKITLFKSDVDEVASREHPVVGSVSPNDRNLDLTNYKTSQNTTITIRTNEFISNVNWKFNADARLRKAFEYTIYKYDWPAYQYTNGQVAPNFAEVETTTVTE